MSSIQDTKFMDTIRAMIAQQGETWAATTFSYSGEQVDRSVEPNAVVIAFSPNNCYRLTLTPESQPEWIIKEDTLQPEEIGKFYAAFGFHWQLVIGALIPVGTGQGDHLMRVRAFIKNGRKAGQDWSISLGEVESKVGYDPVAHAANMQWLKEREAKRAEEPLRSPDPNAAIQRAGDPA